MVACGAGRGVVVEPGTTAPAQEVVLPRFESATPFRAAARSRAQRKSSLAAAADTAVRVRVIVPGVTDALTVKTRMVRVPEHAGIGGDLRLAQATTALFMIRTIQISGALELVGMQTIAATQVQAVGVTQAVAVLRTSAAATTAVTAAAEVRISKPVLPLRQTHLSGPVRVPTPAAGSTADMACTRTRPAMVNWCCLLPRQRARFRSSRRTGRSALRSPRSRR